MKRKKAKKLIREAFNQWIKDEGKEELGVENYDEFMQEVNNILKDFRDTHPDSLRLNKFQSLTSGVTGLWILRDSTQNRGMRLHETMGDDGSKTVRKAIDNFES